MVKIFAVLGVSTVHAAEFPANVVRNQKTIQALSHAGSNPLKPHSLEHHFYSYNPESIKALMSKGASLGYRVANVGDNEYQGTHYWYGDLIKEAVLELDLVNQENSLMLKLADEFNANYDGWGTEVVD